MLARKLSPDEFGLYSFCLFFLVLLTMLARYGLETVLLRFGGSAWHQQDLERFRGYAAWGMSITARNAIGLACLGALVLWFYRGQQWDGTELMVWFLIMLLPWSLLYAISALFKAALQASTGFMFEVGAVNHLIWIGIMLLTFYDPDISLTQVGVVSLVSTLAVCGAGMVLLVQRGIWPKHNPAMLVERKEFLKTCRATVSIIVMQMLANSGGVFFLGMLWGKQEVAFFNAPARLAMATILFTNLVTLLISPRLSGHYEAKDEPGFQRILSKGCLIIFCTNFPTLLTIALASPWIMILMGDNYLEHWPILSVIAIGQAIGVIAGLAPAVLCMTGLEKQWSRATFLNTSVCILITALLSYVWGAMGAAIGAATYQATQNWVAAFMVHNYHGYWPLPGLTLKR